jgi:hypothetical protein
VVHPAAIPSNSVKPTLPKVFLLSLIMLCLGTGSQFR